MNISKDMLSKLRAVLRGGLSIPIPMLGSATISAKQVKCDIKSEGKIDRIQFLSGNRPKVRVVVEAEIPEIEIHEDKIVIQGIPVIGSYEIKAT